MKLLLKRILRERNWALVNTKYKWGIDLYSDIIKILGSNTIQTAIDIGANEGVFASEMLSALSIQHLYCFEPGVSAFNKLNARFAGNKKVDCENYALGETNGSVTLYTFPDSKKNTLDMSMRDHLRMESGVPQEIKMIPLDSYISEKDIPSVDLLKIDVEGHELSVLRGAKQLLERGGVKLIFCEFHKILDKENGGSPHTSLSSLVESLAGYNYRFASLFTQGVHKDENLVTCNVLFAHSGILSNH